LHALHRKTNGKKDTRIKLEILINMQVKVGCIAVPDNDARCIISYVGRRIGQISKVASGITGCLVTYYNINSYLLKSWFSGLHT
jgi:hypothetical protein